MATSVSFVDQLSATFAAPTLCANPKEADWKFFQRQFENYLKIVKADDSQKLPLLHNCIGKDGLMIYDGLPDPILVAIC